MTPQQQIWATGDFSMIGSGQIIVGEQLCDSVPVLAGDRVLDVATGSGNTALAAARRGGRVTGVDFVPALIERARERAAAERFRIEFREGDAEAIPCADESFDVVLSTFGAMFADPARVTSEMLRVCRKGGAIGMANWTPSGMIGELFAITASFAPPPEGTETPSLWGLPEIAGQRFGGRVSDLKLIPRHAIFRHFTAESWVDSMKRYFGPTIRAHEAAGDRAVGLTAAMVDLAQRYNESSGPSWLARADYVEVIAVKK